MRPYCIDHETPRVAAENLEIIIDAGYLPVFERQLGELTWGDRKFHERQLNIDYALDRNPCSSINQFADKLAKVLDAPLYQAKAATIEVMAGEMKRTIAIDLLTTMAGEIRAKSNRRRAG